MKYDVNFCSDHFKQENYKFIHFDVVNPSYAALQSKELKPWPIEDNSKDMVTALSVWTHLCEKDAIFYFDEIHRVLKTGGRAIITFFYLDEKYKESLPKRSEERGRFHNSNQTDWVFDSSAYGSENWYAPNWVKTPEDAIGITPQGLEILLNSSGLRLVESYPGNWKEIPGVYFQDVLVFEK
jgi:predicted SAM-dependent methyltransferase